MTCYTTKWVLGMAYLRGIQFYFHEYRASFSKELGRRGGPWLYVPYVYVCSYPIDVAVMLTECHYTNCCSRWRRGSYSHSFSAVPYLHWTGRKDYWTDLWPQTVKIPTMSKPLTLLGHSQKRERKQEHIYFRQLSNQCVVIHIPARLCSQLLSWQWGLSSVVQNICYY